MNKITKKPWGEEEIIFQKGKTKVKIIRIKDGCKLSLQIHIEKIEFIILLSGKGEIIGDKNKEQSDKNCGFFMPLQLHRLVGIKNAEFIELSIGDDKDIIRLQDDYERN